MGMTSAVAPTDLVASGSSRPWGRATLLTGLCISECIPQAFLGPYLLAWLVGQSVPDGTAASVVALIALPFGLKILWAPLVDACGGSPMGRRRPWVLLGQIGMIAGGVSMALIGRPDRGLRVRAGGAPRSPPP